eukprot:5291525-Alexandrium_andersonii.AAC.1
MSTPMSTPHPPGPMSMSHCLNARMRARMLLLASSCSTMLNVRSCFYGAPGRRLLPTASTSPSASAEAALLPVLCRRPQSQGIG